MDQPTPSVPQPDPAKSKSFWKRPIHIRQLTQILSRWIYSHPLLLLGCVIIGGGYLAWSAYSKYQREREVDQALLRENQAILREEVANLLKSYAAYYPAGFVPQRHYGRLEQQKFVSLLREPYVCVEAAEAVTKGEFDKEIFSGKFTDEKKLVDAIYARYESDPDFPQRRAEAQRRDKARKAELEQATKKWMDEASRKWMDEMSRQSGTPNPKQ